MISTKVTNKCKDDFIASLCKSKKGYKRIGAGAFATVLSKPKSLTVLKIGYLDNNKGYLEYITSSSKHFNNPLFPKIHKITYYTIKNNPTEAYFAIEMERLFNLPGNIDFGIFDRNVPSLSAHVMEKYLYSLIFNATVSEDIAKSVETRTGISADYKKEFQKEASDLLSCLNTRFSLDLHSDNVMVRRVGNRRELVFTDPVWDA